MVFYNIRLLQPFPVGTNLSVNQVSSWPCLSVGYGLGEFALRELGIRVQHCCSSFNLLFLLTLVSGELFTCCQPLLLLLYLNLDVAAKASKFQVLFFNRNITLG